MSEKLITHNDITLNVTQWAKKAGINLSTLKKRLRDGVPFKRAINPSSMRAPRSGKHYKNIGVGHQRSKREHVLIVEKAIGKQLPNGAVIHHIDGDIDNNRRDNLLVCPSHSYHGIIHARQCALEKSGQAHYRKCAFCHEYDDPGKMTSRYSSRSCAHKKCYNAYMRNYQQKRKLWRNA